jgi:hypothetical protein
MVPVKVKAIREAVLASLLLLGVFVADFSWRWLGGTRYSTFGLWYILQNAFVVLLCITNVIFLSVTKRSLSRDIAIYACGIGAIQGAKDSLCRLMIEDPKKIPVGVDVGDFLTGLPLQATLVAVYSLMLTYILYDAHKRPR